MINKIIRVLFILSFSIPLSGFSQTYQLVWSDEFDGDQLNTADWSYETGAGGWGNSELQYYTNRASNVNVSDGILTITALKESYGGSAYTSGRIKTQSKKYWKYGKIEARLKLPYGQGLWPAFWMMGESISSGGWPACGEIDIMEMIGGSGRENTVYGTVHWEQDGHASYGGDYSLSSGTFADDFHVFSIIWTPLKIEWYVDGIKYHIIDITPSGLSEFREDAFILLNLAVGGVWPGYPDETTTFPQTLQADWIRVYQDVSSLPQIEISDPVDDQIFENNTTINIKANVSFSGTLNRVDFYQDNVHIGEAVEPPYEMNWYDVMPGKYTITAVALTDQGYEAVSEAVNIQIGSEWDLFPYQGYPANIPGIIEAENFDLGGSGKAYHDSDAGNNGGLYRTGENVDIEVCSDANGGYNVGWLAAGEWMTYQVNIRESGEYQIDARVASNETGGGTFHIEFDGENKTGTISAANTGGWQNWETVSTTSIHLDAGVHSMKFYVMGGSFNVNNFTIYQPENESSLILLSPTGGEVWEPGSFCDIRWFGWNVSTIRIQFTSDGGSNWSYASSRASSEFGIFRWLVPEVQSDQCLIRIVNRTNSTQADTSASYFGISTTDGIKEYTPVVSDFQLFQNYPNPFNPETTIAFRIKNSGMVKLELYSAEGMFVHELINEIMDKGNHSYRFNAENLRISSGTYYCRLKTAEGSKIKKLVYLK